MTPHDLNLTDATRLILETLHAVEDCDAVPVQRAGSRVLAVDIEAGIDLPPHDNAAMDGYAVRGADLSPDEPRRLHRVGSALAGHAWTGRLQPGQAVRITTGAVMPTGADTVVMQEYVECDHNTLIVPAGQKPGQHVRRRGEDVAHGSVVLPRGRRLRPADLGFAASLGLGELTVFRRLRVAVLSSGDELLDFGQPHQDGRIHDANRATLLGLVEQLGCDALDLGRVADTPQALRTAMQRAIRDADVLLTSGGVSMGEADHVRTVLDELGAVAFWKLAMKPGRPLAFGRLGTNTLLFGLPGNPVASLTAFHILVRPALLKCMGVRGDIHPPQFEARCDSALRKHPGRTEFLRGRLLRQADGWHVQPAVSQSSASLRSVSDADCYIVLPHETASVSAGTVVAVLPFDLLH